MIHGHQAGEYQRPHHTVLGDLLFTGVHDHRHGGGDTLVTAAGGDDHRHIAAVHPRLGCGGGIGAQLGIHAVGIGVQQRATDADAVVPLHAPLCDGHIAGDLLVGVGADEVQFHLVGKVVDILDAQGRAVGPFGDVHLILHLKDDLLVLLDADDVAVAVAHLHLHPIHTGE